MEAIPVIRSRREELWNARSHGFGFLLSLVFLPILIVQSVLHGDTFNVVSSSIFGVSMATACVRRKHTMSLFVQEAHNVIVCAEGTQRRDRAEIMAELVKIRKSICSITYKAEENLPKCPICDVPYESSARKMVCFNVCGHCFDDVCVRIRPRSCRHID